jgi:hypothetical protein
MGEDEGGQTDPEQAPEFVFRFERDVKPKSDEGEEGEKDEEDEED